MTYISPTGGDRVRLSFIIPRIKEELEARRAVMLNWARTTCGIMRRSPRLHEVTFVAWASRSPQQSRGTLPRKQRLGELSSKPLGELVRRQFSSANPKLRSKVP